MPASQHCEFLWVPPATVLTLSCLLVLLAICFWRECILLSSFAASVQRAIKSGRKIGVDLLCVEGEQRWFWNRIRSCSFYRGKKASEWASEQQVLFLHSWAAFWITPVVLGSINLSARYYEVISIRERKSSCERRAYHYLMYSSEGKLGMTLSEPHIWIRSCGATCRPLK